MRSSTAAVLLFACVLTCSTSAQSPPAVTAAIRCESCALSGQQPAPPFDPARLRVVTRVEPVFIPAGPKESEVTLRGVFIARVLGTSPLVFDVLDSRGQHLDRQMNVVLDDPLQGKDTGTCGLMMLPAIAAEVKAVVSSLRFNDLVTGMWLMHHDPSAKNLFLGVPTVTQVQKIAEPVAYFHPTPGNLKCLNRSGRLLEYIGRAGGVLTVYNDGGIHYSTQYGQVSAREGLSGDELKELLGAFGAAGIDALPEVSDKAAQMSGSRLTLAAARHQVVHTDSPDPRLTPVIERLNALTGRAMANARLVLRTGAARAIDANESANAEAMTTALRPTNVRAMRLVVRPDGTSTTEPIDVDKAPETASLHGSRYVWPREVGIRLNDVPADGLPIPWSEIEKHKPIYFALLNSRTRGLALIDGDRLFERVRLCQIGPDGHDSCGPQ